MSTHAHRWPAIWAYSAVNLPLSVLSLPLAIYLAPFYAGEMGLPLAALGTAMLVGRIVDFAVDPFIGYASDRTRTRIGRRKPFVIAGALVLLLASHFLLRPSGSVGLSYFMAWLALLYIGFSLIGVGHKAWGAELSPQYDERTRIASIRQGFGTAGFIVATMAPAYVLSQPGAKSAAVLGSLATVLLIVLPITVGLALWLTPDRQTQATHAARTEAFDWRESLRAVRRNGPLRCILLVLGIGFAAETFRQTMTVFYARDVIGVKNLGAVYVYFFITAFLGVPVWRLVAKRWGKHRALAAGLVLSMSSNLALFALGRGDEVLFVALFIVKGFCFGSLELVPAAMLADAADVDTAISGKRRAGLLFAMSGVVTNVGQALGQFLSLQMLSVVGYQAAGESDPGRLHAIAVLYALVPALVMAFALWIVLRYSLSASRHARLRAGLARREARAA